MTDSEFALTSLTCLIDEPENDPLPAILSPSESHQKLVVAAAVEFAIIEYPPGFGGSEELQREYQSHARIVRDAILAHFKP